MTVKLHICQGSKINTFSVPILGENLRNGFKDNKVCTDSMWLAVIDQQKCVVLVLLSFTVALTVTSQDEML